MKFGILAVALVIGLGVAEGMTRLLRQGQRVENGQPFGGFDGDGISPVSSTFRFFTRVSAIGTAESSASVYG